jgi:hypothetical protein
MSAQIVTLLARGVEMRLTGVRSGNLRSGRRVFVTERTSHRWHGHKHNGRLKKYQRGKIRHQPRAERQSRRRERRD